MRIPRDISGQELIKRLKKLGYSTTRQSGSHVRVTTTENGEHHLTIPLHDDLRIGTLHSIISEIADHFSRDKADIMNLIFG